VPNPIAARNLLDRVIEAISPVRACGRYAARAQIQIASELFDSRGRLRGSREASSSASGAVQGRFGTPWQKVTSYRGGSSSERIDFAEMSDRANEVYDENVVGGGLLDCETDNIVADGFSLHMASKNEVFNKEAERRFNRFLDVADVAGLSKGPDLMRDSWREPRKEGDGGFLLIRRGGYPRLQYIQRDLIRNPLRMPDGQDRREWYDGVRCDDSGRPIGLSASATSTRTARTPTRTSTRATSSTWLRPAIKRNVRGATVYRRIFPQLDQLDSYLDAVTKAAIMGAIFGLIEKRPIPATVLRRSWKRAPNSDGEQQKAVTLRRRHAQDPRHRRQRVPGRRQAADGADAGLHPGAAPDHLPRLRHAAGDRRRRT
jgi:hypothetical protein